jgi:hypothetical protein
MNAKRKSSSSGIVATAIIAVLAIAAYGGIELYHSHPSDSANQSAAASQQAANSDPARQLRITLDPELFVGDVKKAYQVAERDPALLAQMHCYCGCDRTLGHKNLLDCFRDDHGSHCEICTGEAIEAGKLAEQGMPIEKIRDSLRDRFAGGD